MSGTGSPPQVRGKQIFSPFSFSAYRITPAGAGKTGLGGAAKAIGTDHPRRCGENAHANNKQPTAAGSPPQVRGKQWPLGASVRVFGITPAGAGKTRRRTIANTCPEDHPRGCGENSVVWVFGVRQMGSPPRMRGKHSQITKFRTLDRITPADAGKTSQGIRFVTAQEDHPRGCGENIPSRRHYK